MNKLLFVSDLHLRNFVTNRIDNFYQIQLDTLKQIVKIYTDNNCDYLIIAGDIFHFAKKENNVIIEMLIQDIFKDVNALFIMGNHDLINHNFENKDKGSIGVISRLYNFYLLDNAFIMEKDYNIYGFSFNQEIRKFDSNKLDICVLHKYCEKEILPNYIENGIIAKDLIDNYDYDIFIVGDNHKSFIYEFNNKIVFNLGCITRQNISEKKYKPSVILFNVEDRKYEQIYLIDNKDNIFIEDKLKNNKIENRLDSFIELLGKDDNISFDFVNNLKLYCNENKINNEVKLKIENILNEV